MVWKCFPLNLHNWSNSWKWKEKMINEHDIADHECKLYELRKGDKFVVIDDEIKVPVARAVIDLTSEYLFGHIDGMYSYSKDLSGNVVHFAAWTNVKKV